MNGRQNIVGQQASQIPQMGQGTWFVGDRGQVFGPMSWMDVKKMGDSATVSPYAYVREENWNQWAPITWYFRVRTKSELEMEGLLPSRYDALFWLGTFIFMIGIIVLFTSPLLAIMLLVVSPVIEYFALYLESVNKEKAITRTIGNAIAIVWIVIQIIITFIMISAVLG